MLNKITEEMKTAREEDWAHWEQEIERYRNSIQAEHFKKLVIRLKK